MKRPDGRDHLRPERLLVTAKVAGHRH
jgi:hypothetical protein